MQLLNPRTPSVLTLWWVLALSANRVLADGNGSATPSITEAATISPPGMITFPLLPHHVVRKRHLEEGGTLAEVSISATGHLDGETNDSVSRGHYHRRGLKADDTLNPDAFEAQQVAGLFQGYGTHYADLWCGTPPQRQTVIVDTGSGVTAFPCTGCSDCGVPDYHIDALFSESDSTTYAKLTCNECLRGSCKHDECSIGMSYQEGSSWSAHEVKDLCYVGGLHGRPVQDDGKADDLDPFHAPAFAFDMKFGCQTKVTGLFKTQLADGIMGMDVASAAFWRQMYDAGKIGQEAFSLCFSRKDEAARDGTESGSMSMGGTDTRLHQTNMVYSSTQQSSGFYVVHLRKVWLRAGGSGVSARPTDPKVEMLQLDLSESALNGSRVIVDSGTTDTYFSRKFGTAFNSAYKEMTGEKYGHGVKKFTPEELAQQPTIVFQLSGDETLNQGVLDRSKDKDGVVGLAGSVDPDHPLDILLAVPPEHYYEYDPDVKGYVSRFYVNEGSGGVIGANAMMGHDVYFDVTSNRVGWAESTCDYTSLVEQFTDGEITPPDDVPDPTSPPDEVPDPTAPPVDSRIEPAARIPDTIPEDNGDEPNDEPSGEYVHKTGAGVCSGLTCQVAVIAGVILSVVLGAARVVRRLPSGPTYDLADSELELQAAGDFVDSGGYRDPQSKGEFS